MRAGTVVAAVLTAVLLPQLGNAQVPRAPAAAGLADWQSSGAPLVYAGTIYYPGGPTVFFDPQVMVQTGTYLGVPLYADVTREPYSVVYAPVGGKQLRPYEKRRTGTAEGTIGSQVPSFPVDHDVDVSAATSTTGLQYPPRADLAGDLDTAAPDSSGAVGTAGGIFPRARPPRGTSVLISPAGQPRPTYVESIPRPQSDSGIWLQYDGTKWHADGDAVAYAPDEFHQVGTYRGFPVYRRNAGRNDVIYIPAVEGGALTRYRR